MTEHYGPAYQRLHYAAQDLALGEGNIRERLREAWMRTSELRLAVSLSDDRFVLPDWLAEEVKDLDDFWGQFDTPQIPAAVESLSVAECRKEAEKVWDWFLRLHDERRTE